MMISPHADLRFEPFSRRGSYLNIRRFDETTRPDEGRRGLYLRQCHGARFLSPWLAKLTVDGAEPGSAWDEAVLTLRARGGSGTVEIVFDGTDALRLRGAGCSLELEFETAPGASMYPARKGAWEVNARATLRKVLLQAETGGLEALTDWQGENSNRMTARFTPGPDGTWTAALDYFESTWTPRTPRPFEACEAEVRADFADFLGRLPSCAPEFEAARIRAAYVNWSALVRPCGHFRRPAMLMSKNHMSNVWSWDHAFNAMALMTGDPELAWDQMRLMADRQNAHGAFPDAQNDIHEHFNFCKPPIHGWAVSRMRAARPDFFTPDRLRETLAWLEPWTRWWLNHRLWEDGGLPLYLHGNDSGWDNSTFFLKGVPVLTPDLPAFLVLQCGELAEIHTTLGQSADARRWRAEAERLQKLLIETLWDGERFFALRLPAMEKVYADTLIETMPLVRGDTRHAFTLQSISKVLGYACVLEHFDDETIIRHVGVEPTGEDFDSIIKLDRHKRPFNPMVNAGAIAVTDLLLTRFGAEAADRTLAFFAGLFGKDEVSIDEAVLESEQRTGERNRAIAHLLKNLSILENPVEDVLALYFRHCAVQVTTRDLARLGMTLANGGYPPGGGEPVLCPETLRKLLSVTLTCGMYNYAGQWAYEVGFPAKSGVSGGMLGIVPGRYGIGVFSPRVDDKGSSPRGVCVHKRLSACLNLHMFALD